MFRWLLRWHDRLNKKHIDKENEINKEEELKEQRKIRTYGEAIDYLRFLIFWSGYYEHGITAEEMGDNLDLYWSKEPDESILKCRDLLNTLADTSEPIYDVISSNFDKTVVSSVAQSLIDDYSYDELTKTVEAIDESFFLQKKLKIIEVLEKYKENLMVDSVLEKFGFPKPISAYSSYVKVDFYELFSSELASAISILVAFFRFSNENIRHSLLKEEYFPRFKERKIKSFGFSRIALELSQEPLNYNEYFHKYYGEPIDQVGNHFFKNPINRGKHRLLVLDLLSLFDLFTRDLHIEGRYGLTKLEVIERFIKTLKEEAIRELKKEDKTRKSDSLEVRGLEEKVMVRGKHTYEYEHISTILKAFVLYRIPFLKSFVALPDGNISCPLEVEYFAFKEYILHMVSELNKVDISYLNEQMDLICIREIPYNPETALLPQNDSPYFEIPRV